VGLLLVPTVLMGGTLPLVAAWLQKRSTDAGKGSAKFYAINTFGAVFGAGLAGFFLVRQFGLPTTLQIAGVANLLIGVVAIALSKKEVLAANIATKVATTVAAQNSPAWLGFSHQTFICFLVFFTGAVSLGLEVLASRSLSMIFGASLQAFSVMLMAFILGVGGGGLWVASLRKPRFLQESAMSIPLLIAAGLIGLFLLTIEQWALLYLKLRHSSGMTDKFLYHQVISTLISLVIIGIPAALIGSVLPLGMRILSRGSTNFGEQVGKLLTFNTLGAVFGALITGFVLMPLLGLRTAIGLISVLLALAALVIALKNKQSKLITTASVTAGVLLLVSFLGRESWQYTLSSGIFRLSADEVTSDYFSKLRERDQLLYYRDGTDATVAVVTDRQPRSTSERVLSINGKPDGSIIGDLSTEYLLAHLPMLSRPQSKDIFVLGFGTGITAGALLGHPIESITVAENCAPVLEAAIHFEPWNRGVLTNKLTRLYREDARTVLKLSDKKYDIIISEPSNPWTSGIGSVFTREFYQLAASRLNEGGIVAQWFHIYEMNDDVVELVLRTFGSVFPVSEIWETRNGDLILLGAKSPWESSPTVFAEVFTRPEPRKDLEKIDLRSPESVLARQVCSQKTAFAVPGDGPLQSDALPILEYEAPKAFYQGGAAYRLFLADERTYQAAFASEAKRNALSNFSDEQVVDVFRRYGSANLALMEYVSWRANTRGLSRMREVYHGGPFVDLIFRLPQTFPTRADVPPDATGLLTQFLHAEALIHQPATRTEGAEKMEALLRSFNHQLIDDDRSNPSIEWYATKAAQGHFLEGNLARALECVELGLRHFPGDSQLLFMKRLLQAEPAKALRTAELSNW
jgi:spermidine synthase